MNNSYNHYLDPDFFTKKEAQRFAELPIIIVTIVYYSKYYSLIKEQP